MSEVFIAGTGMYLPDLVVTNDDMSKIVDTSDEWISQRTGIRRRRFSQGEPNFLHGGGSGSGRHWRMLMCRAGIST